MTPLLSEASRRSGCDAAAGHIVAPPSLALTPREVKARIRILDRGFADILQRLRAMTSRGEGVAASRIGSAWILENDYIISEALEGLDGALPRAFLASLPGLANQPGMLRIEAIANDLVRRNGGRVEVEEVSTFLEGYQEVHPLHLAELWALPSFLRLSLLEALLREASRAEIPVDVGAYILSLRALGTEDWRTVVESLSRVEAILLNDPAKVYPAMDFRTRDRYRREVERIARRGGVEEETAARRAVELAGHHAETSRKSHVGFYILDEGRVQLARSLEIEDAEALSPARRRIRNGWGYFGAIALLSVAVLVLLAGLLDVSGWSRVILGILALSPAIGIAVTLVNRAVSQWTSPRALPRLDFRAEIPDEFRTLVAVPVLLSSRDDIREILHTLESNAQGNQDPSLTFALLSDFTDADRERVEGDEALLTAAIEGIRELNLRYGVGGKGPFLLLHRGRRWNPVEERWMGWERKRGKLAELNRLLLGRPSGLWVAEGDRTRLERTPFVLTLDADTRLPRGAAARLVGALAHPLNRPEIGKGGRILRGYSILQPRIEIIPDPDGGTVFSRVFGGIQGLDLYARAAFDVYQDLFDVGIFAGKGIYDVQAFEASLEGRTPENSLLSHDLFEGAHGKAGLVSDLILLEDFPGHPLAYTRRAHRWIRGDWQILPWLFSRVPAEGGGTHRNCFSPLSRWMVADNLRRSLHSPSLLLLLLFGWMAAPDQVALWTLTLGSILAIPLLIGSLDAGLRAAKELPRPADVEAEGRALLRALGRWGLEIALLPVEAFNAADAVVRALYRVYGSRRGLLEWTTAAAAARSAQEGDSLLKMFRRIPMGPALALFVGGAFGTFYGLPPLLLVVLLLWLLSPAIAHVVSRPRRPIRSPRGRFPRKEARLLARRVWGYYLRFQRASESWLPPDHFQEEPGGEIAFRTSPTNMGMAMTAAATAWDLGFLTTSRLIDRMTGTLDGMEKLERYRGHFLNWYDTARGEPLHPRYVSTVDSGNLAAALVVVRETLQDARTRDLLIPAQVEGVVEPLGVLAEVLRAIPASGSVQGLLRDLDDFRGQVERELARGWKEGLPALLARLESVRDRDLPSFEARFQRAMANEAIAPSRAGTVEWEAPLAWFEAFRVDLEGLIGEIAALFPWLAPDLREKESARAFHRRLTRDGTRIPSLERLRTVLGREVRFLHSPERGWADGDPGVEQAIVAALERTRQILEEVTRLTRRLDAWYEEMDFTFLYDRRRALFRIGFSVSTGELDHSHYDLLASEARIASFIAIAKGEVPPVHWLHLGRPFGWAGRGPVLLSWAGTMFEYLKPALFFRLPPDTVLEEGCRRAVQLQRDHGEKENLPWGISESGYHVLSREGHYQYRAFGLPILGLRSDHGSRVVVAPYACLMAVVLAPGAVHENLRRIRELGGLGPWGPYEALDYGRNGEWKPRPRIVRSYMSHHHGMILAALGNLLTRNRMVERFHRDARIATVEPYLYERIPWRRAVSKKWVSRSFPSSPASAGPGIAGWSPSPRRLPPPVHHIASRDLVVTVGADGRGGSRWKDWAVVRGGVGAGIEAGGPDLLLLDRDIGESWSPLPDPSVPSPVEQTILFEAHRADFIRKTRGIRTRMEVFLPPGGRVEVREICFTNESGRPRRLRLAYALEVALAPYLDDRRHPAFHKLFVRAELLPQGEGILFERRPRNRSERPPVMLISLLTSKGEFASVRWGTSRENFLGRGTSRMRPAALLDPERLNPSAGPHHPLDPAAAALLDFRLEPWAELGIAVLVAVGPDRDSVISASSELLSVQRREWALLQARAHAEGELLQLNAPASDPAIWEILLSRILHPRAISQEEGSGTIDLRQSTLWRWGISGDFPYILVEGDLTRPSPLLADLLRAQRWWRARGEVVDLVVLDAGEEGYLDAVRESLRDALARHGGEEEFGRRGGLHLVRLGEHETEDRDRLRALAAVRIDPAGAPLRDQIQTGYGRSALPVPAQAPYAPVATLPTPPVQKSTSAPGEAAGVPLADRLLAPSSFGGFEPETGEYRIDLTPDTATPAPWVNIIAREGIGFLVTESGGSFTWAEDAGEFRLTPWHNDPVRGLRGEVLYLRDEESGRVWTPAPGPLALRRPHRIRHGWGRTILETGTDDLSEEVTWTLHSTLPVKVVRLRLCNRGALPRRLSATFFAEWVLGTHPSGTAGRLIVSCDPARGVVVARNPFHLVHHDRLAFLASDRPPDQAVIDRRSFFGGVDPLDAAPLGLRTPLGEEAAPPAPVTHEGCAILRRAIDLAPGEEAELVFYLGTGRSAAEIEATLRELASSPQATEVATGPWEETLGRVRVRTPEEGLDPLMNGWLPYQSIVSRLHGRTGFYQSGGAFGFRDQLQDVYTLLPLDPSLAAAHLVEAARRQFLEGDVLHWWHPATYRGVRTRCSDDLLWLPWVLAQAVEWTGDLTLLDRTAPYLDAPPLEPGEDEKYDAFSPSTLEETLLEHGIRAIDHSLAHLSPRGLPLIGTGDWNDGMDRVGKEGRGESIWLGWFLIDVCRRLTPLARLRGKEAAAERMEAATARIREAIETHGWDGAWYRRAFFDDGSPLGSSESIEAKIDSIAQSWGVISGAADPERARQAIDSAWEKLVRRDVGIALLLSPPFEGKGPDPGYIAAYAPGVRENGGQYTHAATWLLRALALSGNGERAGELLRHLLPTRHAEGEGTFRYRVEPYVAVADIYGVEPHIGRGGWSWYTGSAGWLWRVVLEDILGVRRVGETLRLAPCIPADWEGYEVELNLDLTRVKIQIRNPDRISTGVKRCTLNGVEVDPMRIPLTGSGTLLIEAVLG